MRRRELDRVERKIAGLIAAIADGIRTPGIQQELLQLEARQASLQAELAQTPAAEPPRLHPNLAEVYRERVARLHEALRDGNDGVAILEHVRSLIDRVVLHPGPNGGLEIELIGELAAMLELAIGEASGRGMRTGHGDRGLFLRSLKLVAGAGNHRQLTFAPVVC